MPAPIQLDPTSASAGGILDSLFGTADKALGLWSNWQNAKLDLTEKKTAIPPSVANPTPSIDGDAMAGLSVKTWTIIGVAVAVLGLVVALLLRRK